MRKSEATALLKEVWARKVESDASKGSRQLMTDFLHDFFLVSVVENDDARFHYLLHMFCFVFGCHRLK